MCEDLVPIGIRNLICSSKVSRINPTIDQTKRKIRLDIKTDLELKKWRFYSRIQDEHPILEENESGLHSTIRFGQADKATRWLIRIPRLGVQGSCREPVVTVVI
ncbi:hypothetical protein J6590_100336 [Homalodisca vitripennis]|nr:hypothetical protein J6590_100336 [Homalodisca vitripennis]